ncbi:MAG: hypothetical protein KAT58_10450 [candidate division Zixibacteria bacterium]|nr:hypothetical protein [candidate division Zixibacteria bacterium]
MGSAQAHLLTSHIPVVGSGFCLLLFVLGMIMHSTRVQRIGLFFIFLTALFALWAYLTGPAAAAVVSASDPAAADLIATHREAAVTSFVLMVATGVVSFLGLLHRRHDRRLPNWYNLVVTLLLIICFTLMVGTAGMGVRISHRWLYPAENPTQEITPSPASIDSVGAPSVDADSAAR